jgi:hypothetical protein
MIASREGRKLEESLLSDGFANQLNDLEDSVDMPVARCLLANLNSFV